MRIYKLDTPICRQAAYIAAGADIAIHLVHIERVTAMAYQNIGLAVSSKVAYPLYGPVCTQAVELH